MYSRAIALALLPMMASLGAQGADLVVWWEKGQYPSEDEAVRAIVTAFEEDSGQQVELVVDKHERLRDDLLAAIEAGRPPDFVFDITGIQHRDQWAYENQLVDLTDAVGHFSDLFDPAALERASLVNGATGERGLYALPMGLTTFHIHVWRDLLELAGFSLDDIPTDWSAFWSFWCDEVQPAVREALGREDVWGVGLPMAAHSVDTENGFWQFLHAFDAGYVSPEGELVIDDPDVRRRLIEVVESYTAIYRQGCTPPDSLTWDGYGNNKEFMARTFVMTLNKTLSIPNALKAERPDDYYENAATIDWPNSAHGQPMPIYTGVPRALVFRDGEHVTTAKAFVRFLVGEGWLAHYLNFSDERMAPPMPKLLEAPFWLDPSDPHRMRSAMQLLARPRSRNYVPLTGDWRHGKVNQENVWTRAIESAASGELTAEEAVDRAITRVKEILSE